MATPSHNSGSDELTQLGGFEILEKIGEGGMGIVYRARQTSLERIVALKVLSPRLTSDTKYIDSFLREAKSAARLRHSNIIPVFEAGRTDSHYYYAMEFVDGATLATWVKREGALPEDTVLGIGICVASALKNAWDREHLLHRDIKPDNVMVDTEGNVKVCDLGLAKYFGETTMMSLSGQAFGTPQFMSPEQARAEREMDCRTDIYSLGMTLYFAVTGQIPFHGGSPAVVMARHMTEQLSDPRETVPNVSAHLCRILEKMLAKKVEERYATWDEVLRDLNLARESRLPQIPLVFNGKSSMKRMGAIQSSAVSGQQSEENVGAQSLAPESENVAASASERTELPAAPLNTQRPLAHARGYEQPKKSRTPILISAGILLLLALGAIAFFFLRSPSPDPQSLTAASRFAAIKQFAEQNPTRLLDLEDKLRGFLADFPNSPQAKEANAMLSSVMIERGNIAGISVTEMERQNKEAQRRYDEALARAQANQLQQAQLAAELQKLIQQFPNTPAAQQAQQQLASLQRPPPVAVVPPSGTETTIVPPAPNPPLPDVERIFLLTRFSRGQGAATEKGAIINFATWDGKRWSAKVTGDTFILAPNGDWSQSRRDKVLNYLGSDGTRYAAKVEDNQFLNAPIGDWSRARKSKIINFRGWEDQRWSATFIENSSPSGAGTVIPPVPPPTLDAPMKVGWSANFKNLSQPKTAKEWEQLDGTVVSLAATQMATSPLKTGIRLTKGMGVFIAPHPEDKWGGHADTPSHVCGFRGYQRGRDDGWMRMGYRIGLYIAAPISDAPVMVTEDGELALYAEDSTPGDNHGQIRVKIIIQTTEEQDRLAAQVKALQAFGEFQKSFLASLAQRDYAGAQQQAQQVSDNPLFETFKERAVAFGEVAARLDKFWSSLPVALVVLKGKSITAQNETGVLSGITNGNLELEKAVTGGTVVAEIPIAKLSPDEIVALVTQAKANDDKTLITLAFLYLAAGDPTQAAKQLDAAEKAGVDVKSARKVLEWLVKLPTVGQPSASSPAVVQSPLFGIESFDSAAQRIVLLQPEGASSNSSENLQVWNTLNNSRAEVLKNIFSTCGLRLPEGKKVEVYFRDTLGRPGSIIYANTTSRGHGSSMEFSLPTVKNRGQNPIHIFQKEITHAIQQCWMGEGNYNVLPDWIKEGLGVYAGGNGPERLARFRSMGASIINGLENRSGPSDSAEDYLAFMYMEKTFGTAAVKAFVTDITVQKMQWQTALQRATGKKWSEFSEGAKQFALENIKSK